MIDQELDITNMLKTLHKLKAGVIALTEQDEALQRNQKHYEENMSHEFKRPASWEM